MRFKVPQNIDMQDRILGPLTMFQFIQAVVGGGVCYGIYMSIPAPMSYLLVVPVALLTAAIVFLKINERPFLDFLKSVIEFNSMPKQRVWHHENKNLEIEIVKRKQIEKPNVKNKKISNEQISELANRLDNRNNFR